MREYIGDRTENGHVDEPPSLYELRGVLLHKGASAHHGHYEAQVYNSRYVLLRYRLRTKVTYGVGSKATPLGINSTTRMSLRWNPCTSNLQIHTKMIPGTLHVSKCHFISETEGLGKLPRDAGRK
jgi:hypothetical protein